MAATAGLVVAGVLPPAASSTVAPTGELPPGFVVRREALAIDAPVGLPSLARPMLTLAQLSDIHVIDEGSPLRTEFLDPWMGTAYRPQEALTPQVLERMVEAVRSARSPVSGATPELVITTGDNTDTGQRNEVRWFIDLMDGGVVDPQSGVPGTCGTDPAGPRSIAWSGAGRGYDPEPSTLLAARDLPGAEVPDHADGPGYSADQGANEANIGRAVALPDHAGLAAAANRPFVATGLGLPWYASFGNHDALVQGNAPLDPVLERLASGCAKVLGLSDAAMANVGPVSASGGRDAVLALAFGEMAGLSAMTSVTGIAPAAAAGAIVRRIPADPDRIPLSKRGYIAEHLRTTGFPVGHGFDARNLELSTGYYAVDAAPGVRLLAIETVNEAGGHQGNLDDEQFRWLHGQLQDADRLGLLALVFGHHSLQSMVQATPGAHLGGVGAEPPGCPSSDPAAPPVDGESVRCLLLRHPSVVALVDGHEHRNRISLQLRPGGSSAPGGFWEITTASHIEWPQEARLLELHRTPQGIAIVTSIIDHAPSMEVADDAPLDDLATLGAIARQLSFADPQGHNGRDGTPDPAGAPGDRDTVLLLPDPIR